MKLIVAVSLILSSGLTFGQEQESDTLVYKTGLIRVGQIVRISNTAIKYEYINDFGRKMKTSVRISMLEWYSMDGEKNELKPEFNAGNLGYQDTIYLKSGDVRYARIDKESKLGFKYEFVNNSGKISVTSTRKALINKVIVGDPDSSVAEDFESPYPTRVMYKE